MLTVAASARVGKSPCDKGTGARKARRKSSMGRKPKNRSIPASVAPTVAGPASAGDPVAVDPKTGRFIARTPSPAPSPELLPSVAPVEAAARRTVCAFVAWRDQGGGPWFGDALVEALERLTAAVEGLPPSPAQGKTLSELETRVGAPVVADFKRRMGLLPDAPMTTHQTGALIDALQAEAEARGQGAGRPTGKPGA